MKIVFGRIPKIAESAAEVIGVVILMVQRVDNILGVDGTLGNHECGWAR